jgi:hypothetical protein
MKRGAVFEKTERFLIKPSSFLLFTIFTIFYTLTNFVGRVFFEFLNSVWTKNIKMDSNFFRNFILNIKKIKFNRSVFTKINRFSSSFQSMVMGEGSLGDSLSLCLADLRNLNTSHLALSSSTFYIDSYLSTGMWLSLRSNPRHGATSQVRYCNPSEQQAGKSYED